MLSSERADHSWSLAIRTSGGAVVFSVSSMRPRSGRVAPLSRNHQSVMQLTLGPFVAEVVQLGQQLLRRCRSVRCMKVVRLLRLRLRFNRYTFDGNTLLRPQEDMRFSG